MPNKAMIVAAQPEAAEAGAKVLMKGGNAIDAAVCAALLGLASQIEEVVPWKQSIPTL